MEINIKYRHISKLQTFLRELTKADISHKNDVKYEQIIIVASTEEEILKTLTLVKENLNKQSHA